MCKQCFFSSLDSYSLKKKSNKQTICVLTYTSISNDKIFFRSSHSNVIKPHRQKHFLFQQKTRQKKHCSPQKKGKYLENIKKRGMCYSVFHFRRYFSTSNMQADFSFERKVTENIFRCIFCLFLSNNAHFFIIVLGFVMMFLGGVLYILTRFNDSYDGIRWSVIFVKKKFFIASNNKKYINGIETQENAIEKNCNMQTRCSFERKITEDIVRSLFCLFLSNNAYFL